MVKHTFNFVISECVHSVKYAANITDNSKKSSAENNIFKINKTLLKITAERILMC